MARRSEVLQATGISSSPSPNSRSRILVDRTLARLESQGVSTSLIDLNELPAEALLARRRDNAVDQAILQTSSSNILILGTPVYRASYTGQLKAFFDLFPQDALLGRVVGLIATGAGPGHSLVIDHALRPLVASLRGFSAAQGVYIVDSQFPDKTQIPDAIESQIENLAQELRAIADGLARATAS